MPIIFAQAIMFIPGVIAGLDKGSETAQSITTAFSNIFGLWYNVVFATLIVVFTFLYTTTTIYENNNNHNKQ